MSTVANVDEGRGMIFTRPGELFARVPLGEQLSEDTNAGGLSTPISGCMLLSI